MVGAGFTDLNERLEQAGRDFWREIQAESDAVDKRVARPLAPDEIVPLPERYARLGWKYREPIPQDDGAPLNGPLTDLWM